MRNLEKEIQNKETGELFEAILALKNKKECTKFLRDLLTLEEIREFSRRWKVARLLAQKKSFAQIEKQTGMSSVTIARINYWLHHGMGGYKMLLQKMK